ncbi:MAG TPA: Gldg family protein, partial [Myxococcota bacterium]|nr:Gldg family protein [Myxococcota bacterium]
MTALALCGLVALAFGAGSYYAIGSAGWFARANLALGALALLVAAVGTALRARSAAAPPFRGPLLRGVLGVALTLAGGVALERLATASGRSFDWSFEQRFELSPATLRALAELGQVQATLFRDEFDPRARSTRLLLRGLEESGHLRVRELPLGHSPELEDRFEVAGSNTVVFEVDDRFETVDRPTEGTFYEALYRLRPRDAAVVYAMRGAGEGDLSDRSNAGFSGLAAALHTEGFRVRELVTGTGADVPDDAALVVALAPRRPLRPESLAALERYLARGGRLLAFLEPGASSGLEELLRRFGLESPDALVVDPASGAVAGDAPGVSPLAFSYVEHPVTRGLDKGRMTFFHGARPFV